MKKNFKLKVLILLFGLALLFHSCVGYVSSEPSYVEYARPLRPGPAYIWIDGGWHWDYHRHVYVQRPGYWERPRVGRNFVAGHWQNTPHGKRWRVTGREKELRGFIVKSHSNVRNRIFAI